MTLSQMLVLKYLLVTGKVYAKKSKLCFNNALKTIGIKFIANIKMAYSISRKTKLTCAHKLFNVFLH